MMAVEGSDLRYRCESLETADSESGDNGGLILES